MWKKQSNEFMQELRQVGKLRNNGNAFDVLKVASFTYTSNRIKAPLEDNIKVEQKLNAATHSHEKW